MTVFDVFATSPGDITPSTRALLALKHPDDRGRSEAVLANALVDARPFSYQHRIVRSDGHLREIAVSGQVVTAGDGVPLAVVGTVDALTPWQMPVFPSADARSATDGELVVALRARMQAACHEAYRRHGAAVAHQARAVLASRTQVDDVVQQVFVALWLTPERFDPSRASLGGYLRLQARYKAIDLLRSEHSRQRRELRARPSASHRASAENDVLALLAAEQVRAALAELPERERRPIELAFFGGLSYYAVALELGEAEGTVKSRIRSGLSRLRSMLSSRPEPRSGTNLSKPLPARRA